MVRKRTTLFILVFSLLALPVVSYAGETLESVFTQALANNPRIAVARARLKQSEELAPLAKANWWQPSVSLSAKEGVRRIKQSTTLPSQGVHERIRDRKAGVQATLPLYRGGRTSASISAAEKEVQAARADLMAESQAVLAATAIAYGDIALFSEQLTVIDEWLKDISILKEHAKSMLAAQRATVTGLAVAESQYASVLGQKTSITNRLRMAQHHIFQLAGRKIEHAILPVSLPWKQPVSRDAAVQTGMHLNPVLAAAISRKNEAEYQVRKAKGSFLPEVSLYASFEREFDGARFTSNKDFTRHTKLDTASYGIQLTMPLYDGILYPGVRQARMIAAERAANVHQSRDQVRMQTDDAWSQLLAARERIRVDEQWLDAAKRAFEGVQREFKQGLRSMQDAITARTQSFSAKVDLLQARHDSFVASINLLASIGGLLPDSIQALKGTAHQKLSSKGDVP